MDYIKRIVKAIDFIESNLSEPIGLPEAAKAACFSPFHFHRIFSAYLAESVSEYIRERRLTESAKRLLNTRDKIIEIALDNFFESQESFSRAFFRMYQVTPAKYRRNKIHCVNLDRQKVTKALLRHLQKGVTMEPKIVELPPFKAVGMGKKVTLKTVSLIPKLWEEFIPREKEIKKRVNQGITYGLCEYVNMSSFDEDTPYQEFVCCQVSEFKDLPDKMAGKEVAGGKYAVFTHKGSLNNLRKTYDFIYSTWLPKSGYELKPTDDFERYDERYVPGDPESEIDIYLPVK